MDPNGKPYITQSTTTLEPGASSEKVSRVEQTRDGYGNVTQQKMYDFGNLTTAARNGDEHVPGWNGVHEPVHLEPADFVHGDRAESGGRDLGHAL